MPATRSPVQNPNRTLPRWLAKFFFQCVEAAQRLIARGSLVGDKPIFDNAQFPWVEAIEAQAPAIGRRGWTIMGSTSRSCASVTATISTPSTVSENPAAIFRRRFSR